MEHQGGDGYIAPFGNLDTQQNSTEHSAKKAIVMNSDDDLMTPPTVLLERALREAQRATELKEVEGVVKLWVKCLALSRIVYGDDHWELARSHVMLAKAYLDLHNLPDQALTHAVKGRGILLSPEGHVTSPDPQPQAVLALAVAHYIVGRVFTTQGKFSEAEKALWRANRAQERYSNISGVDPAIDLEVDIMSTMGRLYCKQSKHSSAKEWFAKAVLKFKAAHGATHPGLIPLLKMYSSSELKGENQDSAVQLLQEALEIAEERPANSTEGSTSVVTGSVLQCLARAHASNSTGVAKEYFERACATYCAVFGTVHERVISCKEELYHYILKHQGAQEEVISLLKNIICLKKVCYGEDSLQAGQSYKHLGAAYLANSNLNLARKALVKAKEVFVLNYGDKHRETASVCQSLEVIAGSEFNKRPNKKFEGRSRFKTVV